MKDNAARISLLGIFCDDLTEQELLQQVKCRIETGEKTDVVFINVDVAIKAETNGLLRDMIRNSDFSIVDGMPLLWLSRLYGRPIRRKVSGSDFVPALCRAAREEGWKIFFLGGAEDVPERAAEKLRAELPGIRIAGTYSPPFGFEQDPQEIGKIKTMINDAAPDILVVCLGCPKQEKFIYENYRDYHATVSVCAGATIDFIAGTVRRCPPWISHIGMEWFYRFLKEPRRLFKRYFIDDMKIFYLAWKYRPRG